MKKMILIIGVIFFTGCATVDMVGSKPWYNMRRDEILEAYQNKEISKEKYLEFVAEVDKTREEYLKEARKYNSFHHSIGYHHGHYSHHHSRHRFYHHPYCY